MFVIITWGCTASIWLTKALGSHAKVFCLHHPRNILAALSPALATVAEEDLLTATQLLGTGCKLAGIVHGVSMYSVPKLREVFGDELRVAAVVRDPLPRLRSQFAVLAGDNFESGRIGGLSYIRSLSGYPEVSGLIGDDPERIYFAHSANMLNAVIDESRLATRLFRHEDLTTRADDLADLLEFLSAGGIVPVPEYLRQAIGARPLHKHSAIGDLGTLKPWQIAIVRSLVHADAWRLYREIGYEAPEFVSE